MSRTARTRRDPLVGIGNPAGAAPEDADSAPAQQQPAPAAPGATGPAQPDTAADVAPQPTAQDADAPAFSSPQSAETAQSPAEAPRTRARRSPAKPAGRTAPASRSGRATKAKPDTTPPSSAETSPAAKEIAASAGRPGRPRVPKAGPTTRVTVDLALSEHRELEKVTATIGRKIGRDTGRDRVYVQRVMRVAARRLISDSAFRDTVAADLADGRDELKRES